MRKVLKQMLITQEQKDLVKNLLEKISFPDEFGPTEYDDYYDDELIDTLNDNSDVTFEAASGASKYVLLSNSLPFVIKVPFNGYWARKDDYDEEENECDDDDDYRFVEFYGANTSKFYNGIHENNDYCATEAAIYERMCEMGYEKFFAKTSFLCTNSHKRIFIQERVTPYLRTENDVFKSIHTSKEANDLAGRIRIPFSAVWIEAAIRFYGLKLTLDFMNFLTSDDNVARIIIEDLHHNNYGYRKNGEPCILDYSGYNI